MPGHASVQQTQRYLNVTDEELRKGLEVSWQRNRAMRLVAGRLNSRHDCPQIVTTGVEMWRARQDSNLRPSAPEFREGRQLGAAERGCPWFHWRSCKRQTT